MSRPPRPPLSPRAPRGDRTGRPPCLAPLLFWGLAACSAGEQPPARVGTLTVHAGRVGLVRVGDQAAVVDPLTSARLFGVGPGPRYDVRFDHPDGVLWLMQALGPAVDLRAFEPGVTVLRGVRTALDVPLARGLGDTVEVVAVAADQVVSAEVQGERIRLEVPTSGEVVLLGVWRSAGQVQALGRLALAAAGAALPEGVALRPNVPLAEGLIADLADAPAAWISAELTWDGLRTGLVLGGGLAGEPAAAGGPRAGVRLPRPDLRLGPRAGLLVEARVRAVGDPQPVALLSEHLPLTAAGVRLQVPTPPRFAPSLSAAPDGAGLFAPANRRLSWRGTPAPTAVILELVGTSGCDAVPWRVAGDGALAEGLGGLQVPAAEDLDPLAAPLLEARLTAHWATGLSFDRLVLPEVAAPVSLPRQVSQQATVRQRGWWRGGAASCPADARQGRYVARSLAPDCPAGRAAVGVVIDRCGNVIPLDPPADGPNLCGRLEEDRFLPRGGGPGGALASDPAGGLILALAGARWLLEPVGALGLPPPAALRGDWYRVELTERAGPEGAATVLLRGGPEAGPWLRFEDSGRVRFATGALRFEGRLLAFADGVGALADEGAACAAEERRYALRLEPDGALRLEARLGDRLIEISARRR